MEINMITRAAHMYMPFNPYDSSSASDQPPSNISSDISTEQQIATRLQSQSSSAKHLFTSEDYPHNKPITEPLPCPNHQYSPQLDLRG